MRIKKIKCYEFKELSLKAQERVLEKYWDINLDHDWWDWIYEDASMIGLKITGFDIEYKGYCVGKLTESMDVVIHRIKKDHGEKCGTYQTALEYKEKLLILEVKFKLNPDEELEEEEREELQEEFLKDLLKDYLSNLKETYEYNQSKEAIIETIEANEYEFDIEGNQI